MKRTEEFPFREEAAGNINRRGLLRAGVAGVVAVASGEWLGTILQPSHTPDLVEIADPDTIAVGDAVAAKSSASRADVLVVRVDAKTVVAFDRRCPHLGCPVLWSAERARFECPCHAACFDARSGAVLSGPPRRGLTPVSIRSQAASRSAEDEVVLRAPSTDLGTTEGSAEQLSCGCGSSVHDSTPSRPGGRQA